MDDKGSEYTGAVAHPHSAIQVIGTRIGSIDNLGTLL
jgi:hypothetical protein